MRSRLLSPWACLAAAWLAGCSALPVTVVDGQLVARERWHRGTVVRTLADADVPPRLRPRCGEGAATDPARRWAVIDHRPALRTQGSERRTAVPLAAGEQPADGLPVLVLAQGCQRAWAPRPPAARTPAA